MAFDIIYAYICVFLILGASEHVGALLVTKRAGGGATGPISVVDYRYAVNIFAATVFQLYHGGDMMYEMKRRKPEPTLLPTQGIFNLSHHIGMV